MLHASRSWLVRYEGVEACVVCVCVCARARVSWSSVIDRIGPLVGQRGERTYERTNGTMHGADRCERLSHAKRTDLALHELGTMCDCCFVEILLVTTSTLFLYEIQLSRVR